jgi:Gram-negative bacterial TonB protein C-terminal
MLKPSLVSLLAVATSAMLCSMPPKSQAREQNRLLVVGNIDDLVTIVHPAPQYPYDGQRMRIQGDVQVRIQVDHGRMVNVSAIANSPYLAGVSERWIRRNWRFRPSISGTYIVPISYQLTT